MIQLCKIRSETSLLIEGFISAKFSLASYKKNDYNDKKGAIHEKIIIF